MIRPIRVDEQSPFLDDACALCKAPFSPGDELVVCPEDASRHHSQCWEANSNHCAAYGCLGTGELADETAPTQPRVITPGRRVRGNGRSKVRVRPATSLACRRGCFLLALFGLMLLITACFGVWMGFDYIFSNISNWLNSTPITPGLISLLLL